MGFLHLGIGVAERNPQVQPPIVIEIKKLGSPPAVLISHGRQAPGKSDICKRMGALILIECLRLIDPIGDVDVHQAVVIVIPHRHTHGPLRVPEFIRSQARFEAGIRESSIAVVDVEPIGS